MDRQVRAGYGSAIAGQFLGQVVNHVLQTRRIDYQDEIARQQATLLHELSFERDQLRDEQRLATQAYLHSLGRSAKAEDRELENSPFRWTVQEVRERVAGAIQAETRPLLLIAPFEYEETEQNRPILSQQRFRRLLGRHWKTRSWSEGIVFYEGLLARPLFYDDDDLLSIHRTLRDRPVIVIHGHVENGVSLFIQVTSWNILDAEAVGARLPELTMPGPTDEGGTDQQVLTAFENQVADLCAVIAGAHGDWFHFLHHGCIPTLHVQLLPEQESVARVLAATSAALAPLAGHQLPRGPALTLLTQATLLAEVGRIGEAHRALAALREIRPDWISDQATHTQLLERLSTALRHHNGLSEQTGQDNDVGVRANLQALETGPWNRPLPLGELIHVLPAGQISPFRVVFSPDGTHLVVVGCSEVTVWDVATGTRCRTYTCVPGHKPLGAAFNHGHLLVAVGATSTGGSVGIHDVTSGRDLRALVRGQSSPSDVAFRSDGVQIAIAYWDRTVWILDVNTGERLQALNATASKDGGMGFSSDGSLLAVADYHEVNVWDVATGKCCNTVRSHGDRGPVGVSLSPDGILIATVFHDQRIFGMGDSGDIREVETGKRLCKLADPRDRRMRTHLSSRLKLKTVGVAFSPDGTMAAVATHNDNHVQIRQVPTGRCLCTLSGHTDSVVDVAFCLGGRFLASLGADGSVRIWKLEG